MADKHIEKGSAESKREKHIAQLKKTFDETRADIAAVKGKIEQLQSRIQYIIVNLQSRILLLQREIDVIRNEVQKMAEKLKKDKRFTRDEREALSLFSEQFADQLPEDIDFDALIEEQMANKERAEERALFKEFQVEPNKADQATLRELYLKLSKQFHSDKAGKDDDAQAFHEIQQAIIQAYENHDLHALIALDETHGQQADTAALAAAAATSEDALAHWERQVEALKDQKKRLDKELKALRKSEYGVLAVQMDKDKVDPEAEIAEGHEHLARMVEIRDAFLEVEKTASIDSLSAVLADQMKAEMEEQGIHSFEDFMEQFILEGMDDEDDYYDDYYDDEDDEEDSDGHLEINPNPKFPIDSSVLHHPLGVGKPLDCIVLGTHILDGMPVYDLRITAVAMAALDGSEISQMAYEGIFVLLDNVPEAEIEKTKVVSLNKHKDEAEIYRKIWREHVFSDDDPEDQFIQSVINRDPNKEDYENWVDYLSENKAILGRKKCVNLTEPIKRTTVQVEEVAGYDPFDGIILLCKPYRGDFFELPISLLMPQDKQFLAIWEAYGTWEIAYENFTSLMEVIGQPLFDEEDYDDDEPFLF